MRSRFWSLSSWNRLIRHLTRHQTVVVACILVSGITLARSYTAVQDVLVERNQLAEIRLTSDNSYEHPIRDVDVRVHLSGPNDESVEIAAFWNGGLEYWFRFAPPSVGTWNYCTSASDDTNDGLNDVCGRIIVSEYSGTNQFSERGWPRVSENSHFITYEDGEPLFLMVEAAMEITWKSTLEEVDRYIADRVEKGFNTVWIVPMSHQFIRSYGVINTDGESYFLNDDLSLLNPRYLDYLDEIVKRMNDAGMIVLLDPIWGRMATVYENSVHQLQIPLEAALLHARYLGGRYAGSNVMWLIAGDARYEEEEDQAYWNAFAEVLDRASGGNHLMSAHTTGFRGSFYYFADSPWIDFHTYTPSHDVSGNYNWRGAIQARSAVPIKPIINIEYNFEDLYDKFWIYFADTTGATRITPSDVRLGAYQGILSGAIAGTSYGGNGIWQWATPSTMRGFGVRLTAGEALSLEGSSEMGVLVRLMADIDISSFNKFDGLVTSFSGDRRVVAASNETLIVSYLPQLTDNVSIAVPDWGPELILKWIDPRKGITRKEEVLLMSEETEELTLQPPDDNDWLLTIRSLETIDVEDTPDNQSPELTVSVAPNPFRTSAHILVRIGEPGLAIVSLFDVLGRQVATQSMRGHGGLMEFEFNLKASGLFLYRVEFQGPSGVRYKTGSMVRTN